MGAEYTINEILEMGVNKDVVDKVIKQIKNDINNTNPKIVPFIGAGLSTDYGYYSWGKILITIAETYSTKVTEVKECLNNGKYIEAADILFKENSRKFREKLKELVSEEGKDFTSPNTSSFYISLIFHKNLLITSNYDTVFEKIYEFNDYSFSKATPMAAGVLSDMITNGNNNQSIIFKFHGDIKTSNENDIVITSKDYSRLYDEHSDLLNGLKTIASRYSFLFVGSGLDFEVKEPDRFLKLIDEVSAKDKLNRHYAILQCDISGLHSSDEINNAMKEKYNEMLNSHNIETILFPQGDYYCVREVLKYISEQVGLNSKKKAEKTIAQPAGPSKQGGLLNLEKKAEKTIDQPKVVSEQGGLNSEKKVEKTINQPTGILLEYGMNSCTIYEIDYSLDEEHRKKDAWKKVKRFRYSKPFPLEKDCEKIAEYKEKLIEITTDTILPYIKKTYSMSFIKVVADASFQDDDMPLADKSEKNDFVEKFYSATNLFFNVLDRKQIKHNLRNLFEDSWSEKTVIVDIGSTSVEIYVTDENVLRFESLVLNISANAINEYIRNEGINDKDLLQNLGKIKDYIKKEIGPLVDGLKADVAIIIKNEATFMKQMGYFDNETLIEKGITIKKYRQKNCQVLYGNDFGERFKSAFRAKRFENDRQAYKGYRYGHLILEALFELLEVKQIIPSDLHSIHGSGLAYVRNVVLSGSTNGDKRRYMERAYQFFNKELSINVSSPDINEVDEKDLDSYREHARSIRTCDLLFVCNADGYLGFQTKCDIYGAYLLSIPIAFWKEPTDPVEKGELDYSKLIPHEVIGKLIKIPEDWE